jgi:hypothetical protein
MWGRDAYTGVTSESRRTLDRDVRLLWRSVQALSGTSAREPTSSVVHTARALPALLRHQGAVRLVYDAGLGTFFSQTFRFLREPQHERAVDALLLRIAAVRCVCAGDMGAAAALAAQAEQFLRAHPVRSDFLEDAESAFETWVGVAMQEQFAVAHELLHYLEVTDPAAFARLRAQVRERLHAASATLAESSALATAHDVGVDRPTDYARARAGVEPHTWWYASRFSNPPPLNSQPLHEVLSALNEQVEHDQGLLTEITCDVVAATACALFAQRGNGWTPLLSAASSALALATLGLVVDMDRRSPLTPPRSGDRRFGEWELRLGGLRGLLPDAVSTGAPEPATAPTTAEVADAMRRATGLYNAVLRTRYECLDTWPTTAALPSGAGRRKLLVVAGFFNLRPDGRGTHQREQEEQEWWTYPHRVDRM